MARQRKTVETASNKVALLKLVKKFKAPEGVKWFRTGIHALDLILGGGFPLGRIIEVSGTESAGKSTLGWLVAKVFQDMDGAVIFYDVEATEPVENARKLGVDVDAIFRPDPMPDVVEYIRPSIVQIVTDIKKVAPTAPILVLWDSIAATSTLLQWEEGEKGYETRQAKDVTMGARARAFSDFFSEYTHWLYENNVTLFCINQRRDKIGGWGAKDDSPGGRALKYHAAVRLKLTRGKKLTVSDNVIGFECHAKTEKNKFAPDSRQAELRFSFESGKAFDNFAGLTEVLEQSGRIKVAKDGKLVATDKEIAGFELSHESEFDTVQLAVEKMPLLLQDWIN